MNNTSFFKHPLLLLALITSSFLPLNLFAKEADSIAISLKQQQAMGIAVAPLAGSIAQISHRLPGEIVVPIGQERVVTAAQSGLVGNKPQSSKRSLRGRTTG